VRPEVRALEPTRPAPPILRGQGPLGRAWIVRRPQATGDAEVHREAGLAVPLLAGSGVSGVLEFRLSEPIDPDDPLLTEIEPATRLLGEALARVRAEEELGEAMDRIGARLGSPLQLDSPHQTSMVRGDPDPSRVRVRSGRHAQGS
jgi:hypothetical protein